jgi:hypothetical protein
MPIEPDRHARTRDEAGPRGIRDSASARNQAISLRDAPRPRLGLGATTGPTVLREIESLEGKRRHSVPASRWTARVDPRARDAPAGTVPNA